MLFIVRAMHGINNTKFPRFALMAQFPLATAKRENYKKLNAVLLYLK
jgi:hypothetical protein